MAKIRYFLVSYSFDCVNNYIIYNFSIEVVFFLYLFKEKMIDDKAKKEKNSNYEFLFALYNDVSVKNYYL